MGKLASPCIDGGDPMSAVGNKLIPQENTVNMGA